MREYTGNRIIQPLRAGYASNFDPIAEPQEPHSDRYNRGAVPLETLPAAYWNWFISSISNNDPRVADAIDDFYRSLDNIMTTAEQSYNDNANDLQDALRTLWMRDVSQSISIYSEDVNQQFNSLNTELNQRIDTESQRAKAAESDLETAITAETNRSQQAESQLQSNINNAMALAQEGLRVPVVLQLESQLPTSGMARGDNYVIQDMTITAPGRSGQTWWDGSQWQKVVDDVFGPDGDTIILNTSGALRVANTIVNQAANAMPRSGGTFTGAINIPTKNAAIATSGASSTLPATEAQVGATRALLAHLAGATFTGAIVIPNKNSNLIGATAQGAPATEAQVAATITNLLSGNRAVTGRWTCPTPALP